MKILEKKYISSLKVYNLSYRLPLKNRKLILLKKKKRDRTIEKILTMKTVNNFLKTISHKLFLGIS